MRGTWQTTDGGGAGGVVGIVVIAIVIAAVAGPVVTAALSLLKALLIAVFALIALAGAGVVVLAAFRLRRTRPPATPAPWRAHVLPPAARPLPAPQRAALEAPREVHLHFHGTTAEDMAAIICQHQDGR